MTQYSLFDLPDDEADKIEAKKKEEKASAEKIEDKKDKGEEDKVATPTVEIEAVKVTSIKEDVAEVETALPPPETVSVPETAAIQPDIEEKEFDVAEEVIVAVEAVTQIPGAQDESIIDITSLGDIGRPQKTRKSTEKKSKAGRKSIQEMAASADLTQVPADDVLYQKQYYSIGAVAEMFRENVSLIRYWANEFKVVKPRTNKKGDRHFRPQDIKYLQLIYHLLREKKYTLEGAKDFLKNGKEQDKLASTINDLKSLKEFLLEMKASL